jgi:hypothetical protein
MAFKKGQSGNPAGRKKGVSERNTELLRTLRERGPEGINMVINMALSGDTACLKIWMDKLLPNAKKDSLEFDLPNLIGKTPEQLVNVMFEAMSGQRMSADEINCVLNMIKTFRSNDDAAAVQEVINKSNEILNELRLKNEREY